MVVVRKSESKLTPTSDSIEDLLVIPVSETESVDEDILPIPRTTHKRIGDYALVSTSSVVCAKGCGRRKRRQYENFAELLSRGPVELHIPTIHDFLPMGHRSILKLLDECSIFEAFSYGCEDFFEKIGQSYRKDEKERSGRWGNVRSFNSKTALMPSENSFLEKKYLLKIEESLRSSLISGEISQDLVKELEDKLVTFFTNNPRDTFMSRGLSSLQRAALGAICNFHHLIYKCHRKRRYHVVQVWNSDYVFQIPSVHLSSVLVMYQSSGHDEIVKL
ncbi:uncharacterized protein LOC124170791 [Ischnura elegans]|uniref:uncharacterized protein LOC124170791 n=1 Tax=Ischnura elegans TaxID=197161 RepID=UPI001ED88F72|nr:uncharacterized protein LOC124170791 [Ischnura elegans]